MPLSTFVPQPWPAVLQSLQCIWPTPEQRKLATHMRFCCGTLLSTSPSTQPPLSSMENSVDLRYTSSSEVVSSIIFCSIFTSSPFFLPCLFWGCFFLPYFLFTSSLSTEAQPVIWWKSCYNASSCCLVMHSAELLWESAQKIWQCCCPWTCARSTACWVINRHNSHLPHTTLTPYTGCTIVGRILNPWN